MIKFQTLEWEWDLSNLKFTFNEDSDYFSDKISKSFTFPIKVKMASDVVINLGLVNYNNVSSYVNKIYGYLIINKKFYDSYISINGIVGNEVEITLYYGKEILPVFDKKLNKLPFRATVASGGLPNFAKEQIGKSWPDVTHNFPKVFRPKINQDSGYELFEGFINNYVYDGSWYFPENSIDIVGEETVSVNRNVMQPCPYLLEILKVIFKDEGLDIRGEVVDNNLIQKIVLIPKKFFEKFSKTQFEDYSFDYYTRQETINGNSIDVYERIHTPSSEGSYVIKIRVNMNSIMASYFSLRIIQKTEVLYEAISQDKQVTINEDIDITIVNTNVFDDIKVELKLKAQSNSIADFNNFTYEFKDGLLNVFPGVYTLADFMPDMTVRDFINKIKSWLNLKFDYINNAVYISFLDNSLERLVFQDKSHLEQLEPQRGLVESNLFRLTYPDSQEVLYAASGQVYSILDYSDQEIQSIPMDVLPLRVKENYNSVTAVYPDDDNDLMFCLYGGLIGEEPLAAQKVDGISLTLQDIVINFWTKWLRARANAEVYKDKFYMPNSETLDIKKGLFKYNKKHLIKSITLNTGARDGYILVSVTTETL